MAFFSDTYADIAARLKDWLPDEGGNVLNLALDLINRAQKTLWNAEAWDFLVVDVVLTLNAQRLAAMPADYGKVLDVYLDSDGDGRPDYHYYRNASYTDNGYNFRDVFDKATGHAFSMQFYTLPAGAVRLRYQKTIPNFTGTGTEYSFFPGDLLLLQAQYAHIVDSGMVGPEIAAIVSRLQTEFGSYKNGHQWQNNDMRMVQNDQFGAPIETGPYALDGSSDGVISDPFTPSYDRG